MTKTTHKLLSLLCAAALLLTLLPAAAVAESQPEALPLSPELQTHDQGNVIVSGPIGVNATWALTADGVLTISGTGSTWSYPEEYPEFMDYVDSITAIVIEQGITEIGDYLFFECYNVQYVTIPEGVTRIGEGAFAYCISLLEVTLPGTLADAGEGAFMYCISLQTVVLSSGITWVYNYMFYGCVCLTNVSLPDSLHYIGRGAFGECASLVTVRLPHSVYWLNEYCFYACLSLSNLTLPSSVSSFGEGAFAQCYSLETLTFQGNMPAFFSNCFYDLTVTLHHPAGNSTWDKSSIGNGTGAVSLTLEGYGDDLVAFGICGDNATWVYRSDNSLTISGTGDMYDFDTYAPWHDFYTTLEQVVIEDGITSIGNDAFVGYYSLTSVYCPDSLIRIGSQAFLRCKKLSQIVLSSNLAEIGNSAFQQCEKLSEIVLPESLVVIEFDCFSLSGLSRIDIPASVIAIGSSAFGMCYQLKEIVFWGNAPEIQSFAFSSITTTCHYPEGNETWTEDKLQNYGGTITWLPHYVCPHNYIAGEVTPPTCTEEGYTTYTCELCGETKELDPVEATGHAYGEWYITESPTCFVPGSEQRDCLYCDHFETQELPTNCPSGKFTDVPTNAWYHSYVDFVVERGLMNGTSTTTFAPTTVINRASVAVLLWNMAGKPEHSVTENPFNDVKEDFWYTNAIFWAYENGVVSGNGAGGFNPNDDVTREQLAVMLSNFAKAMGYELEAVKDVDLASFPDGDQVSGWAASYLKWVCDLGLINGKAQGGQNYLAPKDTATRAEIAVIFTNFTKLVENN